MIAVLAAVAAVGWLVAVSLSVGLLRITRRLATAQRLLGIWRHNATTQEARDCYGCAADMLNGSLLGQNRPYTRRGFRWLQ